MAAEGILHLLRREGLHPLFVLRHAGKSSAEVEVRGELAGDRAVRRAAGLAGLEPGGLGVGQFLLTRARLKEPLQFFQRRGLYRVDVGGVGDRIDRESGVVPARRDRHRRCHAVGEPLLLPDPVAEAAGEGAAAEDEVADLEGHLVGRIVVEGEGQACREHGVGLVGREDVVLGPRHIGLHLSLDPLIGRGALPAGECLADLRDGRIGVEVADDHHLAGGGGELVTPDCFHIVERECLEIGDVLLDGAGVAHITFGVIGEGTAEGNAGEHLRLGLHLRQARERLGPHLLKLVSREGGITENLAEETDRLREGRPLRLHAERQHAGTAATAATSATATAPAHADAELVELLPQLLPVVFARSRHEHRGEHAAGGGEPGERLLVAVMERQ